MPQQTCTCPPGALPPGKKIHSCYIEQTAYYLYKCGNNTYTPGTLIVCDKQQLVRREKVDPCGECPNEKWIPPDPDKLNTNCAKCISVPDGWGSPGQIAPSLQAIEADLRSRRSPHDAGHPPRYYGQKAAWGQSTCDSEKCEICTATKRGGSTYACVDDCAKKDKVIKDILESNDQDLKKRNKDDLGCEWKCNPGSSFANTKTGCTKTCKRCLACQTVRQKLDKATGQLIETCKDDCGKRKICSEDEVCVCTITLAECLPPSEIKETNDGGCECYTPPAALSLDMIP